MSSTSEQLPLFDWAAGNTPEATTVEEEEAFRLAKLHNDNAKIFFEAEDFASAEKEIREALKYAPTWSVLYDNLGTVCAEQNNFAEALLHYVRALQIEPNSPVVLFNLGYFLQQNGLDAAQAFLERTIELDPKYPDARRALGEVFCDRGEFTKAMSSFGKAVQQNPKDNRARFRLSDIFWEQGDYHEAAQQLEEITRIDPYDHIAWHNLGLTALMLNESDRAENALRKAIEIDSNYLLAHYHLACFYAEGFRIEEALFHLARAAELDPESVRDWALDEEKLDHIRSHSRFNQILDA
jgi:protein O-GlcNAc transferase